MSGADSTGMSGVANESLVRLTSCSWLGEVISAAKSLSLGVKAKMSSSVSTMSSTTVVESCALAGFFEHEGNVVSKTREAIESIRMDLGILGGM